MSNLTPAQIYAINRKAGFDPISAITATAIALAESHGNPTAIGDRNNPTAGAQSVGLFQINYSPVRDSKVVYRDPKANLDPLQNARSAFIISNGGKNFDPWTTYKNGDYRQYLNAAAMNVPPSVVPPADSTSKFMPGNPKFGTPIGPPGSSGTIDVVQNVKDAAAKLNPMNAVQKIVFTGLFLAAGIGLVVLGVSRATGFDKKVIPAAKAIATDGMSEAGKK